MSIEVLVVDDKLNAALEYASLIKLGTKLEAFATDDPEKAAGIVKVESVKVVVLDQRMPVKKGTALYKELKEIDSRIKVMMLSGEADTQELHDAIKLGYDDYLHKSRIKELPLKVHELYVRYESDLLKRAQADSLSLLAVERRGIWPLREKIEYFLTDVSVLNGEYVFDESWRTVKQINAGEKVAEVESMDFSTGYKYHSASETKNSYGAGLGLPRLVKLQGKIEAVLSEKFSAEAATSTQHKIKLSKEFRLPEAPVNPLTLHVASRHFQMAPVYKQLRAIVIRHCSCCGTSTTYPLVILQPTNKVATRHIDYLSNGTEKVLLTGCETFGNPR